MYICCSTRTLSEEQLVSTNYASIILRIIGQLQSIIGINAENKGIEYINFVIGQKKA